MKPMVVVAITVLPSFVVLARIDSFFMLVYWEGGRPDAPEIFAHKVQSYTNDVSGAFLSVAGVVYGIICAHLLSMANDRFGGIEESLRKGEKTRKAKRRSAANTSRLRQS